jgi:hypothetical protein
MAARTLLSLRTELAQRLGFSSSGNGAILQKDLLNSALRSAQEQLFYEFGDVLTHKVNDTVPGKTIASEKFYSAPEDLNLYKPVVVSIKDTNNGNYRALGQGITPGQRNWETVNDQRPSTWDVLDDGGVAKIQLWPTPADSTSAIRLEYNSGYSAFDKDTDLSSINPQLILLHGMTTMKAHYRQPDYEIYAGQLESLLGRLRSAAVQTKRWFKRTQNFVLSPTTADWEYASNVTHKINNIISSDTFITPSTAGATHIITAS